VIGLRGGGYKMLYEKEKARADRLETELRLLNDSIRTDYLRRMAEANAALKIAEETINTLKKTPR
jgi:hypothetical protein